MFLLLSTVRSANIASRRFVRAHARAVHARVAMPQRVHVRAVGHGAGPLVRGRQPVHGQHAALPVAEHRAGQQGRHFGGEALLLVVDLCVPTHEQSTSVSVSSGTNINRDIEGVRFKNVTDF